MVSYAEVKSYLSKREIPQLFESLMAGLMYHRPENHIHYLQSCLDELKTVGDPKVHWSMFVNSKKRKSKEHLPPLTPKKQKQESVSWSSDSRQSTPLPPISARSRALRSQSMPCNGETLRNTYILYHNPPPVLTPPTVPVIFVIGGLGPKIDNLCEEVVSKLSGLVHISASSMLKTRMIIEGFYRMTSIPACAVVDSVLQAMSMVKSAKALIVAGFPRNRGDIEEYKSRRVRVDAAILVDFEESALRNLLVSEVASGLIKTSEIEYELDRCKQDLISVAEYYDEKELLTVVMGDQNTEDVVGDLVIAIERVLEYGAQRETEKPSKDIAEPYPPTEDKPSTDEDRIQTMGTEIAETKALVNGDVLVDSVHTVAEKMIGANEDDVFSAEITHEIEGDVTESDTVIIPQSEDNSEDVLPSKDLTSVDVEEVLVNAVSDDIDPESKPSDEETKDESVKVEVDVEPAEGDLTSEVEKVTDSESTEVEGESQPQEEITDSPTIEIVEDFIFKETITVLDPINMRRRSSPMETEILVGLTGSSNSLRVSPELEDTSADLNSTDTEATLISTSAKASHQETEEQVDISSEEKETDSKPIESEISAISQAHKEEETEETAEGTIIPNGEDKETVIDAADGEEQPLVEDPDAVPEEADVDIQEITPNAIDAQDPEDNIPEIQPTEEDGIPITGDEAAKSDAEEHTELDVEEATKSDAEETTELDVEEATELNVEETVQSDVEEVTQLDAEEASKSDAEEAAQSDVEEIAEPDVEETAEPDIEETTEPDVEETAEPDVEETVEPDVEETAEPDVEETAEPDVEDTAEPNVEETAEPDVEETAEPDVEETAEPDVEETAEPDVEETAEPDVEETAEPDVEETAEPDVEETAEPDVEEIAEPDVEETAEPDVEETAEPDVEETAEPEVEETAEPDVEETAEPDVEETAEPDVEGTAEPDVEETAEPDVEETAEPDVEEIAEPDVEETAEPNVEETAEPDVEETAEPDVEEAAEPDVEEIVKPDDEEVIKSDAEEVIKSDAEEAVDLNDEEAAKSDAEEVAKSDAEEAAKSDVEEAAKSDAEEAAKSEAEEAAKSDAEETVDLDEEHDELNTEDPVKLEAEEADKADAEEVDKSDAEDAIILDEKIDESDVDEDIEPGASPSDYGTMDEAKDDDDKFIADFDSMPIQDTMDDFPKNPDEESVVPEDSKDECPLDDVFDENSIVNIDIKVTQPLPDPSEASTATASPVSMETALLLPKKTDSDPKPLPIVFTLAGVRLQKTTIRNMVENSGVNLISFEDITKAHFHPMDFDQALHLLKSTMLWERTLGSKLFLVTEFPWELMGHQNIDEIANLGDVTFITDDGPKNTGPESEEEEPSVENDAKTICDSMLSVYFKNQLQTISHSDDTSEDIFLILKNLISEKGLDHIADFTTKSVPPCDTEGEEAVTKSEDPESVNEPTVLDVSLNDKTDEDAENTNVDQLEEIGDVPEQIDENQQEESNDNPTEMENPSHEFSDQSHPDDSTSLILSEGDHVLAHDDESPILEEEKRGPSVLIRQGTFCARDKDEDSVNLEFRAEINQNLLDEATILDSEAKPDHDEEAEVEEPEEAIPNEEESKLNGNDESDEGTTCQSIPSLQKDENNTEMGSSTIPDSEITVEVDVNTEDLAVPNDDDTKEDIPDSEEAIEISTNVEEETKTLVPPKTLKTPDEDYDENDDSENSECKFDTDHSENDAGDGVDAPKTETDKYFSTSSENNLDEPKVLEVTAEVYAVCSTDSDLDTILSNKDTKTPDHKDDELPGAKDSSNETTISPKENGEAQTGDQNNGVAEEPSNEDNDEDNIASQGQSNEEETPAGENNDKQNGTNNPENEQNGDITADDVASENAKNERNSQLIKNDSKITDSETDTIHRTEQTNGHFSAKSRESNGENLHERHEDNEERERSSSSSRGEL